MHGCLIFRKNHEAHIPALCHPSQAHARISGPDAYPRGPGGHTRAAGEGPGASGRLRSAERYRDEQRLRGKAIAHILAGSRPRRSGSVLIQITANGLDYPRLGLVVPKRVLPRAVDRNRARRLMREWFRRNQALLAGKDLLVRLTMTPAQMESLIADLGRVPPEL